MSDWLFITIFTMEVVVKCFANGLFFGKKPYLRSPWNVVDLFVVVTGLADVVLQLFDNRNTDLSQLRVIRCVRCLRPLRLMTRVSGMRRTVECMLRSLPGLAHVTVLGVLLFSLFSIIALNFLPGRFFNCYRPHSDDPISIFRIGTNDTIQPPVPPIPPLPNATADSNGYAARHLNGSSLEIDDWLDCKVLWLLKSLKDISPNPFRKNNKARLQGSYPQPLTFHPPPVYGGPTRSGSNTAGSNHHLSTRYSPQSVSPAWVITTTDPGPTLTIYHYDL